MKLPRAIPYGFEADPQDAATSESSAQHWKTKVVIYQMDAEKFGYVVAMLSTQQTLARPSSAKIRLSRIVES